MVTACTFLSKLKRKTTMGLKGGGIIIFLFIHLLVVDLFFINHGVEGVKSISIDEEDIELERQLKVLNKPPVKTFHTEWGDIVDCVDIYKQPAFDHPLLKNHKIQLEPSFSEELEKRETLRGNETDISSIMPQSIECPDGTVPIRRTRKEDLIRAKSFSMNTMSRNAANDHRFALLQLERRGQHFFGGNADMNVYNPAVAADQFSRAEIWLMSGQTQTSEHDAVKAGWIVDPQLNNDHLTRLFTYWTGDGYQKTGCFNTLCAGFVQADKRIYPGIILSPTSTFGGDQYKMNTLIYQDCESSNWWLKVLGRQIGYWPVSLFPYMTYGAEVLRWGGHVKTGADGISPPMGSGHIPDTCFFQHVQYVNAFDELVDLNDSMNVTTSVDCPLRYSLTQLENEGSNGYSFLYGGPGGEC